MRDPQPSVEQELRHLACLLETLWDWLEDELRADLLRLVQLTAFLALLFGLVAGAAITLAVAAL